MMCTFAGFARVQRAAHTLVWAVAPICMGVLAMPAQAQTPPQRVSLELSWYPQFQFAGYYMAEAKGFYRAHGLDVRIVPGWPGCNPARDVVAGKADFGVGGVEIAEMHARGASIVSLATIFQHSAVVIAVRSDSSIRTFTDLADRTIEAGPGGNDEVETRIALRAEGVPADRIRFVPQSPSLSRLIRRQVDARAVYVTNEPEVLQRLGVAVRLLRPSEVGVDFYGDSLCTSKQLATDRAGLVERMRLAVLEGWRYALSHEQETIDYLRASPSGAPNRPTAAHLRYEAAQVRKLIASDSVELGHQSPLRWQRIKAELCAPNSGPIDMSVAQFIWQPPTNGPRARTQWLIAEVAVTVVALAVVLAFIGNYRLRHAVRRKSVELAAAHRSIEIRGRALHSILQLGGTLDETAGAPARLTQVVREYRSVLDLQMLQLHLVEPDEERLRCVATILSDGTHADCSQEVVPLADRNNPLTAVALGLRDMQVVKSAETAESTVLLPLRAGARVLGVLAITPRPVAPDGAEMNTDQLRGFADEIAIALHNSELLRDADRQREQLAQSNRELAALVAFSRKANTATGPDQVVELIVRTLKTSLGFDRAAVLLPEEGVLCRHPRSDAVGTPFDHTLGVLPLEGDGSPEWQALIAGREDYVLRSNGTPPVVQAFVALAVSEQMVGLVCVDNAMSGRPVTAEDMTHARPFIQHAAVLLRNAQLMDALRDSENRIRSVMSSITEATFSARVAGGRVIPTFFSPQIEQLTGRTPDEMLNHAGVLISILHPDDRDFWLAQLEELMAGRAHPFDFRIVRPDGSQRLVTANPVPVTNDAGEVVEIHGSLTDTTERQRLEEGLRQAQKMETVGTLAGGIAHEFNNLLTIIGGNIELARMDAPPASPLEHSLSQTERAVARAAELTRQLLTFSRKADVALHELSINDVVEETVKLIRPSLTAQFDVQLRLDPDVSPVFGDAGQLQQVLINLCVNARDAMPGGGRITIRTQNAHVREGDRGRPMHALPGHYVRLQVHDTGVGMDEETRRRVFEPFFTTKPVGSGTGLGLAVAYAIVGEHHGWITVESLPDEGTVFSIYLPHLVEGVAPEPPQPVAPGRDTVLVVDSDPAAREAKASALEGQGYVVLTAGSGAEALALCWSEGDRVSLILCDAGLSDMEVPQLVRNLRAGDQHPAIVMTGTDEELERLSEEGPEPPGAVIREPYGDQELLRMVAEAANRHD